MENRERAILVHLDNATKVYRTDTVETSALHGVSLQIREGEYLAITGRSGSGKSTLLSVLGLMDSITSGSLVIAGRDVASLGRDERAAIRNAHLGFVFQFFHLIHDLTVSENIALPMMYAGAPATDIARRVDDLTERLGLAARKHHLPAQLSGGQQQRVAVARALANRPDLLLVDEPTGNLDSESGEQVMALLAEVHSDGQAICLVTHDPKCARHASRQLHMKDGVLSETGPAPAEP